MVTKYVLLSIPFLKRQKFLSPTKQKVLFVFPEQRQNQSHLVYKFECGHCPKCYIGETVRHLGKPEQTEVTKHSLVHPASKDNFFISLRTKYTKTAEAMFLKVSDASNILNEKEQQVPLYVF